MFKSKLSANSAAAVSLVLLSLSTIDASVAATPVATRAAVAPGIRVAHRPLPPGISAAEAARIRYQIKEHKQMQRAANADGEVTRREQARLAHDAAQVRRLINTAKNN
jgi:hypothetical protein